MYYFGFSSLSAEQYWLRRGKVDTTYWQTSGCKTYDQAFIAKRTLNWELPKPPARHPRRREGFTTIITNSRGHLLPNVPKSRQSPWGLFVGTWDMPTKLPGNRQANPTARCEAAQVRLHVHKDSTDELLCGALKPIRIPPSLPMRVDEGPLSTNLNAANPAMAAPLPRTEELQALKPLLTPPRLPMTHDVSWAKHDGVARQPYGDPTVPGIHLPVRLEGETAEVVSPTPGKPATVTGAVDSLCHTVVEEANLNC